MIPIRVLVLDDSAICRARLRDILEAERDIEVAGEAPNGDRVLELIQQTAPRLLVVDLQMPGTDGQSTIERVMANRPLPILVVSGQPEGVRKSAVFEAIRRGALDLAEKPAPADRAAAARLRALVRQLATVPVVRHVAGTLRKPMPAAQKPALPGERSTTAELPLRAAPTRSALPVVGIVASAGGPLAVVAVLAELSRGFGGAVALVQHLPNGFALAYSEFLQGRQPLPVTLVKGRVALRPGVVYLANDDRHLVAIDSGHLAPSADPPLQGHRPSGDVLLGSLARALGSNAAGVILSGIGNDGVTGLREMRDRGALTLAQDKATAGVFGMPRAAVESNAASLALDPAGIARAIRDWSTGVGVKRGAPA